MQIEVDNNGNYILIPDSINEVNLMMDIEEAYRSGTCRVTLVKLPNGYKKHTRGLKLEKVGSI